MNAQNVSTGKPTGGAISVAPLGDKSNSISSFFIIWNFEIFEILLNIKLLFNVSKMFCLKKQNGRKIIVTSIPVIGASSIRINNWYFEFTK